MKNGKTLVISTILVVLMVCGNAASAATAPSPPTNVVCSLSGTSLTVSWKAPSSTPVPIADYRVHIYKNSALSIETFVKEPTHTITFTNQLTATYEAHVRSRTSTGVMSTNSVVAKCSVVTVPPVPVPTFNISGFEINALDNSGLSGWNIRLLNRTTGVEIASNTTDSNGLYNFAGVTNGTYNVTEVVKAGWINVSQISMIVTIAGNDAMDNNFMNVPDTTPPGSIDNLHNESYLPNRINWAWIDPADSDFDHVEIYINGVFEANVSSGVEKYVDMSLNPDTDYEIGTRTVDKSGNINDTWLNTTARTDIPDTTPPDSISNLHNTSYLPDRINWAWTDPTDSDFDHVEIYINGAFKTNVSNGVETYTVTGLSPDTDYKIGTHTVDMSGNINDLWKNDTVRTAKKTGLPTIRFITIGDTHITSNTSTDQYKRFTRAISYVNSRNDIDFVVQMGDIVDSGSDSSYKVAKAIISKLNAPYYVVEGNHGSGSYFTKYFGKDQHMEYFPDANGYQLIFPAYNSGNWSFDYSIADKNRPTIIFNHGQVQPKPGGTSCINDWGSYYSYACSMRPEVDKFTKLLGFYDGHVHSGTHQIIGGRLFVTEDNLGGNGADSDFIGYTVIQDGVVTYSTVRY